MAKLTLTEFRKQFPDDATCLDKIFKLRYGHLTECPKCKSNADFKRLIKRRSYYCRHCYEQFYPTQGTVFEKTTTPLSSWFFVIWLFTTTRNGVAAKEIERQLGVTYKTAWRMGHQIRMLMNKIGVDKLKGFVEIDEMYVGKKGIEQTGRSTTKAPVLGMVERMGEVRAFALPDVRKDKIFPLIDKYVDKSANVNTDEFSLYTNLKNDLGYNHFVIKHAFRLYRIGSVSTNTIEGFFSQIRYTVEGTHRHVSIKYLNNYVGECVLRYNNRKNQDGMFETILKNLPCVE